MLWSILMLCGGLFFLINLKIEMPYEHWLIQNLSVWGAISFFVIFGICFLILSMPRRSQFLNYIAGTMFLLIAFALKVSMLKAPITNSIILFVSILSFIVIKIYYRKRQKDRA